MNYFEIEIQKENLIEFKQSERKGQEQEELSKILSTTYNDRSQRVDQSMADIGEIVDRKSDEMNL